MVNLEKILVELLTAETAGIWREDGASQILAPWASELANLAEEGLGLGDRELALEELYRLREEGVGEALEVLRPLVGSTAGISVLSAVLSTAVGTAICFVRTASRSLTSAGVTTMQLKTVMQVLDLADTLSAGLTPKFEAQTITDPREFLEDIKGMAVGLVEPVHEALEDGFQFSDLGVVSMLREPLTSAVMAVSGVLALPNKGPDDVDYQVCDPKNEQWLDTPLSKRSLAFMGIRAPLEHWDPQFPHVELPFPDWIDGRLEKRLTAGGQELLDELLYRGIPMTVEATYKLVASGVAATPAGGVITAFHTILGAVA